MGSRGIRVSSFGTLALVALLAVSATAASAAPKPAATLSACVASTGEFAVTIDWSRLHADAYGWFMEATTGNGGLAVQLAHQRPHGSVSVSWKAGPDWNAETTAIRGSLDYRGSTVWSERVERPATGWPGC